MSIFKKTNAVFVEKMNNLRNVSVSEDKVMFSLNYSGIEMKPEDIPGLVSDLIQIYGMVKPVLDKKSEALEAENAKTENPDEPIDLSNIPF